MDKRQVTSAILMICLAIYLVVVMPKLMPKPKPARQPAAPKEQAAADKQAGKAGEKGAKEKADEKAADKKPPEIAAPAEKHPDVWATLGSGDPGSPYRMLVTFTSRGAAVERVELNSPRYTEVEQWEDRSGYLGNLAETDALKRAGCLVRVVGPGTPAGNAGLKVGDIILGLAGTRVQDTSDYYLAMKKTHVGEKLVIDVLRDGKLIKLEALLAKHPLEVIKPEDRFAAAPDPLSYLVTLEQLDDQELAAGKDELPGLTMRTDSWKLERGKQDDELSFSYRLPKQELEIVKHFRLAKVPAAEAEDSAYPAYHLEFSIELRNGGKDKHTVAYRLDGPTGLPTEGYWYAYKISPEWWDTAGMRDVAVEFQDGNRVRPYLVSCRKIVDGKTSTWSGQPLAYIGVDAQYFASVLMPAVKTGDEAADPLATELPILVGPIPPKAAEKKLTDVSCRITSKPIKLAGGQSHTDAFKIFAGPKKPDLLTNYGLNNLVYYGMFGFVARPMLAVLHAFYHIIPNYGIAIILLTVLVRSGMFPISRRQALNAQKMQELQPEIKRIAELYKNNLEQRGRAQQELFKKHNYHPMAGCLPALIQLPIFMGLYRSLAVDVELRQAPLLGESIRWCSNLSAPDMLWNWQRYLPAMLASPDGWLGPYLNVLPLVTIGLFIWQQKMFMPPPTDEQSAMQQKMMQYMMIFVSLMFFKVPSGLCIYFIASSMWGIAERKLLPRPVPGAGAATIDVRSRSVSGNGAAKDAAAKRKQRGKR